MRHRLWPIFIVTLALGLASTFASSRGRFVPDVAYELFRSPMTMLKANLHIWSPSPGLGRVREGMILGPPAVLAALRGLGLSVVAAERVWDAGILALAGTGMAALVAELRSRVGVEHWVAALVYEFNVYTAVWLIPTTLFLLYALTPWFLVFFFRGTRTDRPARWAAATALCVLAAGSNNPPVLAYSLLPLLPASIYLVRLDGSVSAKRVVAWLAGTALLVVLVSASAVVVLASVFGDLVGLIGQTENPHFVNVASSWSESIRGMGLWVAYGRGGRGPWLPQLSPYLTNPLVVAATFGLPVVALAALRHVRDRARLLFGALMVISVTLMVGAYGGRGGPSWAGHGLLWAYDNVSGASSLRNSYKAGPGLLVGLAGLVGLLVADKLRRHVSILRKVVASTVVGGIVVTAAFPFWTGRLFNPDLGLSRVPEYWVAATKWLDRQPGQGRVLFEPGSQALGYRWGDPGSDIFEALLARQHVTRTWISAGTPQATNLLNAVDDRIETGTYVPGSLAPIARALGIRWIVIRNDIDWQATNTARPGAMNALRDDPTLRRVASFGRPGENVRLPSDSSLYVFREAQLAPVEIFAVPNAGDPVSARAAGPPTLISGDADASILLARDGLLDGRTPVASGSLSDGQLKSLLRIPGVEVVLSDTNRRRVRTAAGPVNNSSHTLAAGANLPRREATRLFGGPDSETVATYGDAEHIEASSYGSILAGDQSWLRPSNAFDGDTSTAWAAGALGDAEGQWLRVKLYERRAVRRIKIIASSGDREARRIRRVEIAIDGGHRRSVVFRDGIGTVDFGGRLSRTLRFTIAAVAGPGLGGVGFREVSIEGLDLAERIVLPSELSRRIGELGLQRQLHAATEIVQVERSIRSRDQAEEQRIARRFSLSDNREFDVTGTLRLRTDTPDSWFDALVGGERGGAGGGSPYVGDPRSSGLSAVDGRPDTFWRVPPQVGETLRLRFPSRSVRSIRIRSLPRDQSSGLLSVSVGPSSGGPLADEVREVPPDGVVRIAPVMTNELLIRVTGVEVRPSALGPLPISVSEVEINDEPNPPGTGMDSSPMGCVELGRVGGQTLLGRIGASLGQVYSGQPVPFTGCSPVVLGAGAHDVDAASEVTVDDIRLTSPGRFARTGLARIQARARNVSPTSASLDVSSDGPAIVTNAAGFDHRWKASIDGRDAGPALSVLGTNAWLVERRGRYRVTMRFEPQARLRAGLGVSAVGALVCVGLIVSPRRRR